MKVLFTFGGLPHYYNYVLNRLNGIQNLEIIIVVPNEKSETLGAGVHQTVEGLNAKVYRLNEYKTFYGKPFFKGFYDVISSEKPDIIVTIWPYILAFVWNIPLLFKIKLMGIKLILKEIPFRVPKYKEAVKFYLEQGLVTEDLKRSSFKFLGIINYYLLTLVRKIYYNIADAHVNYIQDAYEIIGSYGVPKEKIFITYNSPDTDILEEAYEEAKKLPPILTSVPYRLIHVGRLVKWKRVDLIIKALSLLKNDFPGAEAVIIGDGPDEKNLKELASILGLSENIRFVGSVYDPVLLARYFIISSVYVLAGMGGLSINEAMNFGKPVICSVCDGTEKILVRENFNGKYFEVGDEKSLAGSIRYLFNNPGLIERMGQNSLSIIRTEINIHTVINGYIRAFNYVTNNKFSLGSKPN